MDSKGKKTQYKLELEYLGQNRIDNCYPIKSFIDEGTKITFHSDIQYLQ